MAEPWNIRHRRAVEAQLQQAQAMIDAREETAKMVEFEHRTDRSIHRRLAREEAERTKRAMEADLQRRRAR
jgi:hypothetical protein